MRICILCKEMKDDSFFNEEHIILKSLGGTKKFKCVCEDCNSNFGDSVDAFASDTLVGIRYLLNIAGRNGIPNPFKESKTETFYPLEFKDNPGIITNVKVLMEMDKKGYFKKCTAIPGVYDYAEGKLIVSDEKNFGKFFEKTIDKLSEKYKHVSVSALYIKKDSHSDNSGEGACFVEKKQFLEQKPKILFLPYSKEQLDYFSLCCFPLALKMAYEYICVKTDMKYLDDDLADSIRSFLKYFDKKKDNKLPTYATCEHPYKRMDDQEWEQWMDLPDHNITINIKSKNDKIIAKVDMFHFFNYEITISENPSRYPEIDETLCNEITSKIDPFSRVDPNFKIDIIPIYVKVKE